MPKPGSYTFLFISWTVFIILASFFSFEEVDLNTPDIPHLDKVIHFVFYFGFAVLAGLACRERKIMAVNRRNDYLKIFLAALLFGTFIEVLQVTLTTWRSGDILDAVANSAGALAGTAFLWRFREAARRPDWKN